MRFLKRGNFRSLRVCVLVCVEVPIWLMALVLSVQLTPSGPQLRWLTQNALSGIQSYLSTES